MYVVIFKAEISQFDKEYDRMAARMRELAISEYGCLEFVATTEENREVALSYWDSAEQIKAWRDNAEHELAQQKGQDQWYKHYTVEVAQIERAYGREC